MKQLYLDFVDRGVANRFEFDDHELIEMNKNLRQHPKLFYHILMHELGHGETNSLEDFKHDMKAKVPGLFKFMANHISTWTQVLPFYWDLRRNKIVYDVSYIASWIMITGITVIIYFLLRWIYFLLRWIL